ncbi:MAG: heat-shock protein Hsp20 [Planctomycetota bacterium]|nr:MAG: heat-shock protein Hsp20 [Planctomycetota bacterium]
MFLSKTLSPSRNLDPFSVFEELFALPSAQRRASLPPLDLWEEGDVLHLELELPGVAEDELELSVFERELQLRVRAEEEESADSESAQRQYLLRERRSPAMERSLRLPYKVDAEGVEAELQDGLLRLRLPKAESLKPRRIAVKRGGN